MSADICGACNTMPCACPEQGNRFESYERSCLDRQNEAYEEGQQAFEQGKRLIDVLRMKGDYKEYRTAGWTDAMVEHIRSSPYAVLTIPERGSVNPGSQEPEPEERPRGRRIDVGE